MGAITNNVIAPRSVHLSTVRNYSDRLKAWHAALPSSLTLSTAVQASYESPLRTSTLLIHCSYLSSITQLTRRLLVERVTAHITGAQNNPASSFPNGWGALTEADEFSRMCVSAARQLATVCTTQPGYIAIYLDILLLLIAISGNWDASR